MADFINTIDLLGDDVVMDGIIDKSITEFNDNMVTRLGNYAFHNCIYLKTAKLPNLTTLGSGTFQNCTSLKILELPNLTSIGGTTFMNCTSLEILELPKLTTIGGSSFSGIGLTKLCLPALVNAGITNGLRGMKSLVMLDLPVCTEIGSFAFSGYESLAMLILRSETICTIDSWTFNGMSTKCPIASGTGYIYVPRALVDSYKSATNWSVYADRFRALEDYTVDGTTTGELDETKI